MAGAFKVYLDKTKFENIEYDEWKKLVQYILNYDLWLSNIEKLDQITLNKLQLEAYIKCRGIIPADCVPIVDALNQKLAEAKRIKQEIEIAEFDLTFKVKNRGELKKIEDELQQKIVNKGKLDQAKKSMLYFQNPYFLKGDDQMFQQRLPSLKDELKNLDWIIKHELKPVLKKSIRMMNLIRIEFLRILKLPKDADIMPIVNFTRPYLNDIVTSETYFYQELLAYSLGC